MQQQDEVHESAKSDLEEAAAEQLLRRGDVEKCPVCGSRVDAEAYYCPTCCNYFCFHCRARLLPADTQLQCVNQQCDYYGKLVCAECNAMGEKEDSPSVYAEPEDGYWPAWLVVTLIASALSWYFYSFLVALAAAVIVFALGGLALQRLGLNIFGRERKVEHRRTSSFHTCIRCEQPVKRLT
jgi:hypothetical protein